MKIRLMNHFEGVSVGVMSGIGGFCSAKSLAAEFMMPGITALTVGLLLGGLIGWSAYRVSAAGSAALDQKPAPARDAAGKPILRNQLA
jgi:hypothetical protein